MMVQVLVRAALLAGLLIGPLAQAAPPPTVWPMPTEYPASAIPGEGIAAFAKRVTDGSDGRLTVVPRFDAPDGLRSAEILRAVQAGRMPAGDVFSGALAGADPILGLSALPFLATSIEDARRLLTVARPVYDKLFAGLGQKLLYTTPWPASGLWSKSAIATGADFKALSIRTYDAVSTEVMRRAGSNAVNLSFADAMPRLKDGSVNAVLSSGDGGAGRKLWDYLPHFAEIGYAMPLSFALVNLAAYDALPADLRALVDKAAAETETRQWAAIISRLDENYTRMRGNGVQINSAVAPEIRQLLTEAGRASIEDWLQRAGPDGRDILNRYRP